MLEVQIHEGPRDILDPLFAEADDSESEIASYKDRGEVLVGLIDGEIVGHAQIVETSEPRTCEIKSLAVYEQWRSQGIGAALVGAAIEHCRHRDGQRILVATAAASIFALQFYQRQGFRLHHVVRDFYVPERGYETLELNGIALRDEVVLDFDLGATPPRGKP
jgi:GNAT superfamily N-acetyltransferase